MEIMYEGVPDKQLKEFVQELYNLPEMAGKIIPKSDIAMYALDNFAGNEMGVFNRSDLEFFYRTGFAFPAKEIQVWV